MVFRTHFLMFNDFHVEVRECKLVTHFDILGWFYIYCLWVRGWTLLLNSTCVDLENDNIQYKTSDSWGIYIIRYIYILWNIFPRNPIGLSQVSAKKTVFNGLQTSPPCDLVYSFRADTVNNKTIIRSVKSSNVLYEVTYAIPKSLRAAVFAPNSLETPAYFSIKRRMDQTIRESDRVKKMIQSWWWKCKGGYQGSRGSWFPTTGIRAIQGKSRWLLMDLVPFLKQEMGNLVPRMWMETR